MSRPVMYKTVERMKNKADEYFNKCSSFNIIPNMLDLTLHLGFKDRHSLYHYSNNHSEFSDLITSFKTRIESIIFQKMFNEDISKQQTVSLMFYLKTVHGYNEKEMKEYISISEILEKKKNEIELLEKEYKYKSGINDKESIVVTNNSDNNLTNIHKKSGRPKKKKDNK